MRVKNWAIARQVLAAMSFSSLRMIDVKARATATRNEAVAIAFSSVRFAAFFISASSYILTFCKILRNWPLTRRGRHHVPAKATNGMNTIVSRLQTDGTIVADGRVPISDNLNECQCIEHS